MSILKRFDLPKAEADEVLDAAAQALADLAGDIEVKEELMGDDLVGDDEDNNSSEGLADIQGEMSVEQIVELNESLQPMCLVLVKVNSVSDSI